jgi:PIN domain nuclease of toxin-antitoxin system
VRALLDTATLIFSIAAPERLSKRAYDALRRSDSIREISSISLAEIAVKNTLGKLKMPAGTVEQAIQDMMLRVLPFTADHAYRLFELPLHHRDPFDRQIIAQALAEGISVVTPDEKFSLYKGLRIVW